MAPRPMEARSDAAVARTLVAVLLGRSGAVAVDTALMLGGEPHAAPPATPASSARDEQVVAQAVAGCLAAPVAACPEPLLDLAQALRRRRLDLDRRLAGV